tara:strand:- start:428 stop:3121 length:2694 start_codon:yes stop_codon:yes gene_type:complete
MAASLSAQSIDPETLRSILEQGSEGQEAKGDSYESFTQNNYAQTLTLLEEIDRQEEQELFYSSLMQSRIDLASKLCSKDPRACYLIDEYRNFKFNEEDKKIENLELFGLDVFIGYPINLDSFNELPLPDDYSLKVGDELKITINGLEPYSGVVQVSPMGDISIPKFGSFSIAGNTLRQANEKIKNTLLQSYPAIEVFLSLSQLKPKQVFVLGNVLNPGSYGVNAFATAINALITSGGLKPNSSLRSIKINSKGKDDQFLDLYDFLIDGKTNSDVLLEDGDSVLVQGIEDSIHVLGEVIRPAIYEIKAGETIADAIRFSLGLTGLAETNRFTLQRRTPKGSFNTIQVSADKANEFELNAGDRLIVNSLEGELLNNVNLSGSIRNPGEYKYYEDAKLSDYIDITEGLLDNTYTPFGVIKRFNKSIRAWTFIEFDLLNYSNIESLSLEPRDHIYVFSRNDLDFLNSTILHSYIRAKININSTPNNGVDDSFSDLLYDQSLSKSMNEDSLNSDNGFMVSSGEARRCLSGLRLNEYFLNQTSIKISAFAKSISNEGNDSQACPEIFNQDPELLPFLLMHSIPVLGNVRLPGLYSISKEITPLQIYKFAGGPIFGNLQNNTFDVIQNTKSTKLNYENLSTVKNIQFLNVQQFQDNLKQGYVRLYGEVRFPGTYSISDGETISSVYKRAGGLTSLSYPLGGILTRQSVKDIQQKVLIKAQKDLGEVLSTAAMNGYLDQNPTDLVQLIALISSLSESDGLGRIVAELDPNLINRNPTLDIMLEDGDNIFIPRLNSTITIVGNVLNPITVPYNNKFDARDYIKLAGGYNKTADKNSAYIIYPNGVSNKIKNNLFSIGISNNPVPGSTIIVPRKATNLDTMGLLKFATPILADLSVTAASISAISNN